MDITKNINSLNTQFYKLVNSINYDIITIEKIETLINNLYILYIDYENQRKYLTNIDTDKSELNASKKHILTLIKMKEDDILNVINKLSNYYEKLSGEKYDLDKYLTKVDKEADLNNDGKISDKELKIIQDTHNKLLNFKNKEPEIFNILKEYFYDNNNVVFSGKKIITLYETLKNINDKKLKKEILSNKEYLENITLFNLIENIYEKLLDNKDIFYKIDFVKNIIESYNNYNLNEILKYKQEILKQLSNINLLNEIIEIANKNKKYLYLLNVDYITIRKLYNDLKKLNIVYKIVKEFNINEDEKINYSLNKLLKDYKLYNLYKNNIIVKAKKEKLNNTIEDYFNLIDFIKKHKEIIDNVNELIKEIISKTNKIDYISCNIDNINTITKSLIKNAKKQLKKIDNIIIEKEVNLLDIIYEIDKVYKETNLIDNINKIKKNIISLTKKKLYNNHKIISEIKNIKIIYFVNNIDKTLTEIKENYNKIKNIEDKIDKLINNINYKNIEYVYKHGNKSDTMEQIAKYALYGYAINELFDYLEDQKEEIEKENEYNNWYSNSISNSSWSSSDSDNDSWSFSDSDNDSWSFSDSSFDSDWSSGGDFSW